METCTWLKWKTAKFRTPDLRITILQCYLLRHISQPSRGEIQLTRPKTRTDRRMVRTEKDEQMKNNSSKAYPVMLKLNGDKSQTIRECPVIV